jgi:Winged helix DNA-binding domain
VVAARLRAQLLTDRSARSPLEVVRHLLAIQAQDGRGARLAIRARSTGVVSADVDRALAARELVVSWLNRGTLHLVAAEDYLWLHPLTTPRLASGNVRRLRQEGVSARQAERGIDVVAQAVAEGPQTRAALRGRLDAAGVPTAGQALVHLLAAATLAGHVVRGPMIGSDQAFVSVEGWLGSRPRPTDRVEALARLATRYLAGHAPASAEDLARWAGITLKDARTGLASTFEAEVPARAGGLPAPRLLGPFDPLLQGWVSRTPIVGAHRSVVTTNGLFRPVALVGGRVVATWSLEAGVVRVSPLEPISDGPAVAARRRRRRRSPLPGPSGPAGGYRGPRALAGRASRLGGFPGADVRLYLSN